MIDHRDYVPILRGKKAEFDALETLTDDCRMRTKPLIEVSPLTIDSVTETPNKTLEDHLGRTAKALHDSWSDQVQDLFSDFPPQPTVIYDVANVESDRTSIGEHPAIYLHAALTSSGIRAIPVSRLGDTSELLSALSVVAAANGICIRLGRNEFSLPSQLATDLLLRTIELGVGPDDVDLLIDLERLEEEDGPSTTMIARAALEALPDPNSWRSVIVAGSSFPTSISGVSRNDCRLFRRAEWDMYLALIDTIENLPRLPSFGDYAIEGFKDPLTDPAPRVSRKYMTASIRYTASQGWLVVRGDRFDDHGSLQYHKLAAQIVNSPHWIGEDFSWGDSYIASCANYDAKPGHPQLWRQVGVSHHAALVTHDLANLFGSSASPEQSA